MLSSKIWDAAQDLEAQEWTSNAGCLPRCSNTHPPPIQQQNPCRGERNRKRPLTAKGRCRSGQGQGARLLVVAEAACDFGVGVDTPIAEERPARPNRVDLGEIDLLDEHDLAVGRRADKDASVGAGDEALAPELDAARAAR